jgi:acyl carrier protein
MQAIDQQIRQFIIDTFLFGAEHEAPSNDDSLLEQRIMDSTGVLEIVAFLEERFGVKVEDEEMLPANLDSISKLAAFVERKRS